jgi:MFS family permease
MTAELGLYCDLEWARDMIQSVFSLGSFAGLIVMNLISDTKGRRISTLLSLGFSLFGVTCILFDSNSGYFGKSF